MDDLWFFLSYARRDAIGEHYISHFYKRLAEEVARKKGLSSNVENEAIGFYDQSGIEPGERWPEVLGNRLQACRVLVCLYSPAYFNSDYCGREFQVFLSRLEAHANVNNTELPPLILPVFWEPPVHLPNPLPQAVQTIQFSNADFSELYRKEGLRFLLQLQRYRDEFEEFVRSFAGKIVQVADSHNLSPLQNLPSLMNIVSAFKKPVAPQLPATGPAFQNEGPGYTHLVVIAGRQADLDGIKQEKHYYGSQGGHDWHPYIPEVKDAILLIVQRIATEQKMYILPMDVKPGLVQEIRRAAETNTPVLIIIDPWSIKVKPYQQVMSEYDQYDQYPFVNCGILVLWNDNDAETRQNQQQLYRTIQETFSRNLFLQIAYISDSIHSAEALENELRSAIAEIRRRLIQRARAFHRIEGVGADLLPNINGPG